MTDADRDFFERAACRLLPQAPDHEVGDVGDHLLNPDFADVPEGRLTPAAVLIGLVERRGGAHVVLTHRTAHLKAHAGQVAFPGGKIDAGETALEAALREANEEIGLSPAKVSAFGFLDPYRSRTGYRIQPVLARIAPDAAFRANPHEVEEVFEVPLSFLMDPANHQRASLFWEGRERFFHEMPYGRHRIWGVTAGILHHLFETLYEKV